MSLSSLGQTVTLCTRYRPERRPGLGDSHLGPRAFEGTESRYFVVIRGNTILRGGIGRNNFESEVTSSLTASGNLKNHFTSSVCQFVCKMRITVR